MKRAGESAGLLVRGTKPVGEEGGRKIKTFLSSSDLFIKEVLAGGGPALSQRDSIT